MIEPYGQSRVDGCRVRRRSYSKIALTSACISIGECSKQLQRYNYFNDVVGSRYCNFSRTMVGKHCELIHRVPSLWRDKLH